jgi:hypothetical protein
MTKEEIFGPEKGSSRPARDFPPAAPNIKGRTPVQRAAFWLEALWMALSLPPAKAPGQPSQKERRNFGMQAGSKGRV